MGSSAFCCFFTKWHGWLRGCPVSVSVAMTTFCVAVSTRQALRSWGPLSSCAVTLEGSSVVCLVSGRCKSHRKVRSLDLQNGMFTHQLAIPPRFLPRMHGNTPCLSNLTTLLWSWFLNRPAQNELLQLFYWC